MVEGPARPGGDATARPPRSRASRAWLVPLVVVLFLLGAIARLAGGDALVSTTLVYARSVPEEIPGNRTPEDTVRSFYLMLDRGLYEEAWSITVEPDWAGRAYVPYKEAVTAGAGSVAPTPKEQFVERLQAELGYGGVWLKLHGVDAHRAADSARSAAGFPIAGLEAEPVCRVDAEGQLLGACTIFRWSKALEVVEVPGKNGYRVLLEGTKRANSLFYQEWFTNVERIGTLRAVGP
jgi:hypothetical protein